MKRYSKQAAIHAKVLIGQGWTNEEIRAVDVCEAIPFDALRRWRFRMKEKSETANETPNVKNETAFHYAETVNEKNETDSKITVETTFSAVETPQNVATPKVIVSFARFIAFHFTRMDCVFYTATVTACYSFWHIAPGVPGATFALLYWLLAFDALQRVKAASENAALAEAASVRVWGLEIFAAVAHWNLIREYLFSNLEKLPFEVKQVPQGGVWVLDYSGEKTNAVWQNGDLVSLVAAILSCSICAAVIVAIDTTFKSKKAQ